MSTRDNVKLLKQLESVFKITINRNKYLSKATNQVRNRYLYFLIHASFQGVNRLFVLSFKDENGQESYKQYYLLTVEIKYYNFMIDGRNFFDQPIKKRLPNSQLNNLKSAIKNGTEVTLNLSSNLIGSSNDKTNFQPKLLLTDTQVSNICKWFIS